MITLRLNSFTDDEIEELINRLNVINPENTIRCATTSCDRCKIKHLCYSVSCAIQYAEAYLDGRESNMKYTNLEIREMIHTFVDETGQNRLYDVIPFCVGYYGYITKQIWGEILTLVHTGVIQR